MLATLYQFHRWQLQKLARLFNTGASEDIGYTTRKCS
jgi:hypothetical protein